MKTAVAAGLFLAWTANDIEELITMREDSRRALSAAPQWLPLPAGLREGGVSQAHITTGVSIMGGLMAAASVDGARSGCRSPLFQSVLVGFGLHGFGHLLDAAWSRRWTSGSLTSPTVVIPYWIWATHRLRTSGVDPLENVSWRFVASTPLIMAAVHGAAWAVRRGAGTPTPLTQD